MLSYDGNNVIPLSILIALLSLSLLLWNKLAEIISLKGSSIKANEFLNSAFIYWIARVDNSGASQVLFFILTSHMILTFSVKYGLIFTGINYLSFVLIEYIKLGYPSFHEVLPRMLNYLLNFTFVFGFSFVAKLQILQREKLEKTKRELERAYEKLQESYDTKEQLLIERERNKIAGEIHDTVGHTLTTVIVELEASKRLMKKDMDRALEKLELAQEQVRKGLNDIRKSVRTLKDGGEDLEFVPAVVSLIKDTEKHSGVTIDYTINDFSQLNKDIQRVLLRALQEGLTNGIRHGQSSQFSFSITEKDNNIIFNLSDNGCGAEGVNFGFGLSNMKHRVEHLNGSLTVSLQKNRGCIIIIEIPLGKEVRHGEN
jgi:signal transduction histidine kinase